MSDWDCGTCAMPNVAGEVRCNVCGEPREKRWRAEPSAGSDEEEDEVEEDDNDETVAVEVPMPETRELCFLPADVLPPEAMQAWGMDETMAIKLVFESAQAMRELKLDKVSLLAHVTDARVPVEAVGNGCIVAQQLERIVAQYWATRSVNPYHPFDDTQRYLLERLPTLNEHCALCDASHPFGSMLNPSVCERPLCAHQYRTFGRLLIGECDMTTHAEVLDLLIATTRAAAVSPRRGDIFTPFPLVQDPKAPVAGTVALDPARPNYTLAEEVMKAFPNFEEVKRATFGAPANGEAAKRSRTVKFDANLDKAHPLCTDMFEWILASNRAHIVSLDPDARIRQIPTAHQFVMLSAPPERQKAFNALKAQYSTKFVWHGSSFENWHAIMRTGLKNCSGTKLMTAGDAYGNGIYLSTAAAVSLGFSTRPSSTTTMANLTQLQREHTERLRKHRRDYKQAVKDARRTGLPIPPMPPLPAAPPGMAPLPGTANTAQAGAQAGAQAAASASAVDEVAPEFLTNSNDRLLIALCEVVELPDLRKTGSIWVAPNENSVVTRFLFSFPKSNFMQATALPSDTTNADFEHAVRTCIERLERRRRSGQ